ncbi:MAG: TRAP transporter small permease [Aestuariivita sp.]|nr:TRAP transporter small permease [Aestuariivita sp.]
MAESSSILEDGSRLSRIDQFLQKFERALAMVSGVAVFLLMAMAVVSVGGRNLFNWPLPGYVDWVEAAMPLIAFMGVSYVQRDGTHIRMDLVIGRLKGRILWFAELLGVCLIFLLMAALVWGSWAHFERSFDWDAALWSRDSTIDIGLPLWPAKILAPIAFGALCLRLLLQIWGYGRALIFDLDRPVAVPLTQDATSQALSEADTLIDTS